MIARRVRLAVLLLLAAFVSVGFLAPYLVMIFTALKPSKELFRIPGTLFPTHWDWSNFVAIWHFQSVTQSFKISLYVSTVATLLILVVAIPASYYTARHSFRGRKAYLYLVIITQMFAPIALLIGLYREFVAVQLVNTDWSLIITDTAFNLAFAIWILTTYFASIPLEIEEAAKIDGCSRFTAMIRVTLPLAVPGIITAVIFSFTAAWNEFVVALTLINSSNLQPLTLGIYDFIGKYNVQYQYLFAASLLAIVPVVVLFAAIEKYLVSGFTSGSIK